MKPFAVNFYLKLELKLIKLQYNFSAKLCKIFTINVRYSSKEKDIAYGN